MSTAATTGVRFRPSAQEGTLETYRDDGPIARALGGALGRLVPVPAIALVVLGGLPALVLLVLEGDGASKPAVAAVIAWMVMLGGISSGRPLRDRLRWAVPPLVRLSEYGTLLWLAAIAGPDAEPAAFALLCALAFRHYDLVYRIRHQGAAPPPWVGTVALGWDGRLVAGFVLLAAGAVQEGFFIAAGVFALAFVGDSVASWRRFGRAQDQAVYEDEEDEGQ
jgi:hypothetical protein